ncbi:prosaposin [Pungitius pungitius]|uniref:prosaposin n=1 Tax=Pungitius pungitius TaxID=134920 RepID=UPI002E16427B
MALFKIALLPFVCALTSAFNIEALQNVPNAPKATGDVCKDCTQIFELLGDMVSNVAFQKKMMDGLDKLCQVLPGPATKMCQDEVEKMLPMALSFIAGLVKPADVCKIIGLCDSPDKQEMLLSYFVREAIQVSGNAAEVQATAQCTFCVFLMKTLEELLPKERSEDALIKLLEEICHIMPSSYRDQCHAVIGKFSKTVLDAILSYATPQSVCTLIGLCDGQEALGVDLCTVATYRCRDMNTALKCGTVFYCQKFAWKPLNAH